MFFFYVYCHVWPPFLYFPFVCFFSKMAATQDGKQKDNSEQNFDYMFKLLIIGNSSVGKTSFLFRYADDSFTSAFVSTVGIDFRVKTVYRNDKSIKLQIWVKYQGSISSTYEPVFHLWSILKNGHFGHLTGNTSRVSSFWIQAWLDLALWTGLAMLVIFSKLSW